MVSEPFSLPKILVLKTPATGCEAQAPVHGIIYALSRITLDSGVLSAGGVTHYPSPCNYLNEILFQRTTLINNGFKN